MPNEKQLSLLGEYECRLDVKGRIMLPSSLQRQLPPEAQGRFIINRGFEKCLNLYPFNEWEHVIAEVNALSDFVKENREFKRLFSRGTTELTLDSAHRLLIPKRLLDFIEPDKDLILFASGNKIEIWPAEQYDDMLSADPGQFSALAEKVMAPKPKTTDAN